MRRTTSPASTRSTASGTYSHWRNRSLSGAAETAAFSKLRRLRGRSRGAHDSARGVTPAVRAVPSDRARRSGARTPAAVDRRLAVVRRGGGWRRGRARSRAHRGRRARGARRGDAVVARAVGVNAPPAPLEGWVPVRVQERDVPVVEWCWLGGLGFDEPFFVQTVERAFRTKSSDGLEPSTPSLPWNVSGDRSQPATRGQGGSSARPIWSDPS